eukprot:827518-Rhodomonas_salina.1
MRRARARKRERVDERAKGVPATCVFQRANVTHLPLAVVRAAKPDRAIRTLARVHGQRRLLVRTLGRQNLTLEPSDGLSAPAFLNHHILGQVLCMCLCRHRLETSGAVIQRHSGFQRQLSLIHI